MTDPPLLEAVIGLIASVGAWFSWKAKKEAGEANRAGNHTEKGQPRLYDLAVEQASKTAGIAEKARGLEKNMDKLQGSQEEHGRVLQEHGQALNTHGGILERLITEPKE